ncbi:peptidoglycan-binding protein LysM [Roseobacter cerasinus]|uniref:Peptidoglycan-binding protein LysM n=1 Tax=Roseobacter cerasinus TaxID=2602289 RepID=A0A640VYM0_9RHOB|nr:DUF2235 domain-containing protein [Roseobacter cerasinus]GFE52045.1 peptidoglycan-binding protein LysM [Roseobacter cerasinus]
MAHIAIFCDGTWNSTQSEAPTHVLRLSRACLRSPEQIVIYTEGVGTGTGRISGLGRWLSRVGGGLFGWGLNRNIASTYLQLCQCYQPGDKILIFGFSRGAFTARSLAGLIRKCGILEDPTPANLRRAFRLYRRRGARNAPDQPHIRAARQILSPRYATSQTDIRARADDSHLVRIAYLGVWDTVGALGIPEPVFGRWARWWNARYAFHDTRLSHLVEAARHAVALDERRKPYIPTLWDNLDDAPDASGLNQGDSSPDRPYQQMWFVGDHGIVGGSAQTRALADIALAWIWEGAARQGLRLTPGVAIPDVPLNPVTATSEIDDHGWLYRWVPRLLRWRQGPDQSIDVHDTVRLRVAGRSDYRPLSLRRLMPALSRLDETPPAG